MVSIILPRIPSCILIEVALGILRVWILLIIICWVVFFLDGIDLLLELLKLLGLHFLEILVVLLLHLQCYFLLSLLLL